MIERVGDMRNGSCHPKEKRQERVIPEAKSAIAAPDVEQRADVQERLTRRPRLVAATGHITRCDPRIHVRPDDNRCAR